jgi:hypothetical protein
LERTPGLFSKKKLLAALVKATKMTHHAAFFKADGLSAFRAFFSHQAVLAFVIFWGILAGHVTSFQYP